MNWNTFTVTVILGLTTAFIFDKAPIFFGSIFAAGFIVGLVIPISSRWKEFFKKVIIAAITLGLSFAVSSVIFFFPDDELSGMFIIALVMGTLLGGFSILVASLLKNIIILIRQKYLIKA